MYRQAFEVKTINPISVEWSIDWTVKIQRGPLRQSVSGTELVYQNGSWKSLWFTRELDHFNVFVILNMYFSYPTNHGQIVWYMTKRISYVNWNKNTKAMWNKTTRLVVAFIRWSCIHSWDPFNLHRITLIPATLISNHIPSKVWGEITYQLHQRMHRLSLGMDM